MKTYSLRTKNGTLIARIGGVVAMKILSDASGKWRDYNAKGSEPTQCFEFSEPASFGLTQNDSRNVFQMYIWENSIMILEK